MKTLTYEQAIKVYYGALRNDHRGLASTAAIKVEQLGLLVDLAGDLRRPYGLRRAIAWADRILATPMLPRDATALVHYFTANAWSYLRALLRPGAAQLDWEQPESEREIAHLRQAQLIGGDTLAIMRRCQIHTNLGNALNSRGRLLDALLEWEAALSLDSKFAMAHANRGRGLMWYARVCYDPVHVVFHLHAAYSAYGRALACKPLPRQLRSAFSADRKSIAKRFKSPSALTRTLPGFKLPNRGRADRWYREWCARKRLFLNDLNDLDNLNNGKADVLTLPTYASAIDDGPTLIGFFNQLKQEFVTARWLAFEGSREDAPVHFADRDVTLVDTLDYPAYSIGAEKLKLAFRSAYSLFDKIAFFLNDYFGLDISERDVSFRKLWYEGGKPKNGLRRSLAPVRSIFLQALFWLSKDFFESGQGFFQADPQARQMAELRNELEHKYLKLHDVTVNPSGRSNVRTNDGDRLAYSLSRHDFALATIEMLRRARNAIMYLAFAVRMEEERRAQLRSTGSVSIPIVSPAWKDSWKR